MTETQQPASRPDTAPGSSPSSTGGVPPELPGVILAITIALSAFVGIRMTGIAEMAWRLALPQFAVVAATVTAGWIVGRQRGRWWLPLCGFVVFGIAIVAVLTGSHEFDPGNLYLMLQPWVGLGVMVVIALYCLLGLPGALGRSGGWTWTAFVLLVLGVPLWTAVLLAFSAMDSPYEDALSVRLLVNIVASGLVAVMGAGLAAARSRAAKIVGALLLTGCALSPVLDLLNGAEVWSKMLLLVGSLTAAACAWVRALTRPTAPAPPR